ncbi:MAG: c-type cytochrome, partial [Opitutaceae bacterium]|nr:c-type cytochrome [Opitutaceae bacterium]
MNGRTVIAGLALFAAVGSRAEPVVTGYERFHAAQPDAAGGRLLYNELGCVNCHGGETGLPARRGADLKTVTTRARAEWLQTFIAEPARVHAGTTMPHLLAGRPAADVADVVHYLGTLTPKSTAKPKLMRHINADRGRDLYHTRGCVACHAPRDDYAPPEGRPPAAEFTHRATALPVLTEKYVLGTLAEFIRDPLKVRPDGRMPRVELEEQDALDIASYLLGLKGSDGEAVPKLAPFAPDKSRAERGRGIVAALRCAACHDLPANVAVQPVPLSGTTGGCLSDQPAAGVPRYALSAGQRRALQAFLAERDRPLEPGPRAALTLEALNCAACHERDGRGGPDAARKAYFHGDHGLGDTGRYPPPLTDAGRKLQPDWLARALKGTARVRPYLQTKMPVYGVATDTLPALLAQADARSEHSLPAGDVEAGRKLLGTQG